MNTDPAFTTYEAFAAIYNEFNASNDYEMWLGRVLLPELRKHGLGDKGAALDVGCGTGRAFAPLLTRGWRVCGCDLSPAMLSVAAEVAHGRVELHVADMRALPHFGDFDLVLSLNDSVNYLLGDDDLAVALAGMGANLAGDGLLIFDVNSRSTFSHLFESGGDQGAPQVDRPWIWTGCGEVEPSIYQAEITGDQLAEPIRHTERFRPEREVQEAMQAAGIRVLAVLGMSEADGEVLLSAPPDESRDYKIVFIGVAVD